MVAFTQGLLQSADPKTLSGFFGPAEPTGIDPSSRAASPIPNIDGLESFNRSTSATSLPSLATEEHILDEKKERGDGVFRVSPQQFSLKTGGKLHVFELSLGGGPDFGNDRVSAFTGF